MLHRQGTRDGTSLGDQETWRRISAGDAEVFHVFYRETAPRLLAFLRQIIGNCQGAEDVTQETFLKIWTRPDGFAPERGSLRAYVFGMGKKGAANWWRTQKPGEVVDVEVLIARAGAAPSELGSIVGDAFERLPKEQRALLWLREVEGYSYAELAEILNLPLGTIRSRLFAAREALRTIWRSKPQCSQQGAKR